MDLYEILDVSQSCCCGEIERAYRIKRARFAKNGWQGWLVQKLGATADIDYAYSILADKENRRRYDENPADFLTFTRAPPMPPMV